MQSVLNNCYSFHSIRNKFKVNKTIPEALFIDICLDLNQTLMIKLLIFIAMYERWRSNDYQRHSANFTAIDTEIRWMIFDGIAAVLLRAMRILINWAYAWDLTSWRHEKDFSINMLISSPRSREVSSNVSIIHNAKRITNQRLEQLCKRLVSNSRRTKCN